MAILRDHHTEMLEFERDEEGSFLALGQHPGMNGAHIHTPRTFAASATDVSRSGHRRRRSRRALKATITVDADMRTAPMAGVSRMPTG